MESMRQSFARLTRLMETINFCRLMKYHTIGIAYCSGMLREGRIVNALFKKEGFETVSAGCKVGGFSSEESSGPAPCGNPFPSAGISGAWMDGFIRRKRSNRGLSVILSAKPWCLTRPIPSSTL